MLTLPTIALLGSTLLSAQQVAPAARSGQLDELFAVLDAIDPLDTSRLPFVRVAVGQRDWVLEAEPWSGVYRHGFLLEADGPRFRVRYVELDSESLVASPPGTPERFRVGFVPADLREHADELAAELRASAGEQGTYACEPAAPLSPVTVALLTARACARSGHAEHVERLLAAVRARRPDAARPLLHTYELPGDLAIALTLAHGDPRRSWKELLALHVAWLRAFPATCCPPASPCCPLLQRHLDDREVRTAFVRALAALPREALLAAVPPGERAAFDEQLRACLVPLLDPTPLGDITVLLAHGRRTTLLRATHADVAACKLHER